MLYRQGVCVSNLAPPKHLTWALPTVPSRGGRADAVAADLATPGGPHALAAQVRDLIGDRLDILVSNAGISKASPLEDMTVKDFDELFAVNIRAPYFLVRVSIIGFKNGLD